MKTRNFCEKNEIWSLFGGLFDLKKSKNPIFWACCTFQAHPQAVVMVVKHFFYAHKTRKGLSFRTQVTRRFKNDFRMKTHNFCEKTKFGHFFDLKRS